MTATLALLLLAMAAGLAVAAFCAGAETGFLSVNRGRILHMARGGSRAARTVQSALRNMSSTVTGLLVGNNLAAVTYSSASAAFAAAAFGDVAWARTAWSCFSACLILVLGEFVPKLFCSSRPLRRTLRLAPAYRVFAAVLLPLTWTIERVAGLFSRKPAPREKTTPDDLLRILQDRKAGVRLTDFESALVARILVLRKKGEPVTPEKILSALDDFE